MLVMDISEIMHTIICQLELSPKARNKIAIEELNDRLYQTIEKFNHSLNDSINWIKAHFGPIGVMDFPLKKMGNGSTLDLITLDDLILFAYYWVYRRKFEYFVDVGANIGLHSLIADKCGYKVIGFEPAPLTYKFGKEFLARSSNSFSMFNKAETKKAINIPISGYIEAAVSSVDGIGTFTQFDENPFGNHVSGKKGSVYGPIKECSVNLISAKKINTNNAVIKIDAEGSDAEILESLLHDTPIKNHSVIFMCDWRDETREKIFYLSKSLKLNLLSSVDENIISHSSALPKNRSTEFALIKIETSE